jgi:hypothetical protein
MTEWTVTTLKEHFEALRADDLRAVAELAASNEKALQETRTATEKRFDSVNEFRGSLSDQTKTYVTKAELYAGLIAVTAIIGAATAVLRFFTP